MAKPSLLVALATALALSLPAAAAAPERSATVTCEDAASGRADSNWRSHATAAGPFGFSGPGRNFKKRAFKNNQGFFSTKVPAILEGSTPVTVRVSDRDVNRAGLTHGHGGDRVANTLAEIRFEPCPRQVSTGWPGGFVLRNRKPVKLHVQVEGDAGWAIIVVGKRKRR